MFVADIQDNIHSGHNTCIVVTLSNNNQYENTTAPNTPISASTKNIFFFIFPVKKTIPVTKIMEYPIMPSNEFGKPKTSASLLFITDKQLIALLTVQGSNLLAFFKILMESIVKLKDTYNPIKEKIIIIIGASLLMLRNFFIFSLCLLNLFIITINLLLLFLVLHKFINII